MRIGICKHFNDVFKEVGVEQVRKEIKIEDVNDYLVILN